MRLSRRQIKAGGNAQRMYGGVDFRAHPAAAAADRFGLCPPFSHRRYVDGMRTMVKLAMAYLLSASAASASKIRCQTLLLLQRVYRVWITRKSPNHSGKCCYRMPAR